MVRSCVSERSSSRRRRHHFNIPYWYAISDLAYAIGILVSCARFAGWCLARPAVCNCVPTILCRGVIIQASLRTPSRNGDTRQRVRLPMAQGNGTDTSAATPGVDNEIGAFEIAEDFGKSLVQGAVISPLWNGLGGAARMGRRSRSGRSKGHSSSLFRA